MYFKSLELVGFKSFAEKTVIGFEPGITAIVGPNGCGKSNVSDAIRWVLGEQNARNLRGSLMEDLIFGGSSQLDPMGMAEVSLTLGDATALTEDEYDEVTVSRRLFRSGESQYFLNKRPCRLRDIHRVFMDTGMGMQAYSFIQQGNIDLILSSKPEDRRFLFDESAGISQYKASKKVAVRKLEATEANLIRLSDLIREVKRQIISIQRQAGKARRYKAIADELQALEVGFLLRKRHRLSDTMESLLEKRKSAQAVLDRIRQEVEMRENRVQEVRDHLRGAEMKHEELQSRRLDILRKIDRQSSNISLFEQRIADTRALSQNVSDEIKKMTHKAADLHAAIRDKQESADSLSAQKQTFDGKLKEKDATLNQALQDLRRAEILSTELSNGLLDLIRHEMEVRSKLSTVTESTDRNTTLIADMEEEKHKIQASIQEKAQACHDARANQEKVSTHVARHREVLADLRERAQLAEEELNTLREDILESETVLSRLRSERRFLAQAVQQYEGYDEGVREVIRESKKNNSALQGIFGTVADVIEVSLGFEPGVEAALEGRVQWVLTRTQEDARNAAAFLLEKGRGRATFLPLNQPNHLPATRPSLRHPRHVDADGQRPLLDHVSCDPQYDKVMNFLLGRAVLCRDMDHALLLAEKSTDGLTFVTPTGERVEGASVITAGKARSAASDLVSRKSRLASLSQEEEAQASRLRDLRTREQHLIRTLKDFREQTDRQTALVSETQERAAEAGRNLLDLSADLASLRRRADEVAQRRAQAESERNRSDAQKKVLSQELSEINAERTGVEAAIAANRHTVEDTQGRVASLEKQVAEITLARASYDERIGNLHSDIEYMRGQMDLTTKEIQTRTRRIQDGDVQIKELAAEVEECHAAVVSLNAEKDKVTVAIKELDEKRRLSVEELTQAEWEIKEKGAAAREREKEVNELDIKLAEIRFSINGIDEHLRDEYGLSHDDPGLVPMSDERDPEEVQRTITEMKRRLQSMGPVNLCALDQHESLEKRYDFLMTQEADLIEAKDSLLKAIARLDRESKTIFREAFERIREEFRAMFKRLFGGGRADLVLVDESNILESGIEIIARPPGKKLQTISLLSGGERAMTAISLLFAIFKVKPSPFCLLDEIDAPLDDSNILRFAEVLKEFAENSQFIIITHNKRTIATSDVLYGITMAESGKSKVVSARLTRRNEEASAPRAAEASSQPSRQELVAAASAN